MCDAVNAIARVTDLLPRLDTVADRLRGTLPAEADEAIREIIDCVRIALDRSELAFVREFAARLDPRDEAIRRAEEAEATLARVKELALMGGQDPILIRQWIIAELHHPNTTKES